MNYSVKYFGSLLFGLSLLLSSCLQEETTTPVVKNIDEAVFASGHIDQEHNYKVSSTVEGIILSLPVKEGDVVSQNDLIAGIENDIQNNNLDDALAVYNDAKNNSSASSPQLLSIATQIEQAKEQLTFDEENYLRYKDLWEKNSVSRLEFEKTELQYKNAQNNLLGLEKNYQDAQRNLLLNLERSQVQVNTQRSLLKDYELRTQASGQVINVFKKQGELIRRGEAIAQLGSGAYIIKLFVAEEDITKINLGQSVAVNINTYPDQSFAATISKIYPGFDESEQSYIVEARFEQLPEKMFSGTQLQANIETGRRKNVLVIPTAYVSKGNVIKLENGEEKQIVIGSQSNNWTEVVSGLSNQDVLVKPNI